MARKTDEQRIAACPFGIHEALHTAHVVLCMFEDHVREHPAVSERPDIAELAEVASNALAEVYQAIGRID